MNRRLLSLLLVISTCCFPALVSAAATRFDSPNYSVESVIFGGTGVLRSSAASIPPVITSGPTAEDLTSSTASISWATDKDANSVVFLGTSSGSYPVQTGDIVSYDTAHEVNLASLQKGTTYFFKVRSTDIAGNQVESAEQTFSTDPGDIVAPKLVKGPTITRSSATTIIVTWETDEISSSLVDFGVGSVNESTSGNSEELTLFHQVTVAGLRSLQTYQIRVKSKDTAGNTMLGPIQEVTTLSAPSITDVRISDITLNSALVQWKTTAPSNSTVNYGTTTSYGQVVEDKNSFTESHIFRLSNLESGSTYYLQISGKDDAGNNLNSDQYVFKTVILPTISNFRVSKITSAGATLNWTSSSDIDELVRYTVTKNIDKQLVGKQLTTGDEKLTSQHEANLENLESDSEYTVVALGKDVFGNQATSSTLSFTTMPDSEPPLIENVRSDTSVDLGSKKSQVLVSFGLSELGTSYIEYGAGPAGSYDQKVTTDTEVSRNKFMVISNLEPGQSYHFRIVASDRAGNTARSADYLVLAPSQPISLLDLIFGQVRDNFGWLTQLGK